MSDLKLILEYGGAVRRFAVSPSEEHSDQLNATKDALLWHCEAQAKRIAELEASVLTQHMWMTERGHSLPPDSVKGLERYTELEAEVAALRVDAGRWRWLVGWTRRNYSATKTRG